MFPGQNGKYLHFHDDGFSADAELPVPYFLELRDPTRICIKTAQGTQWAKKIKKSLVIKAGKYFKRDWFLNFDTNRIVSSKYYTFLSKFIFTV